MAQVPAFNFSTLPADTDTPKDVIALRSGTFPKITTRIDGRFNGLRIEGQAPSLDGSFSGAVYVYRYHDHSQSHDPNEVGAADRKGWWPWLEAQPMLANTDSFGGKFSALLPVEDSGPVDIILVFDDDLTLAGTEAQYVEGVRR